MRRTTRFSVLVACTAALSLLFGGMALADNVVVDGDNVASGPQDVALGNVCKNTTKSAPADVFIQRNGGATSTNTFKNSATVSFTRSTSGAGLSATIPGSITIPSNWQSQPNNSVTAIRTSTVSFAAGSTTGAFSGTVTFTGSGLNHAGDTITREDVVKVTAQVVECAPVDTTPPVITKTVSGTQGSNGWYTSNVTVAWTVTDNESTAKIDSGCGTQTFLTETASVTSSCSASSAGGESSDSVTLKIDKTAPTDVALAPSGTAGQNDWYTSNVDVSTSGTDALSGVSCTAQQSFTNETAGTTVNGSCTNGAGLTTPASQLSLKIDKSAPSASLAVTSGTPGDNGWYTSDVTVGASGSDSISGPVTCDPSSVSLTTNTDGTAVNSTCTNGAGLSTAASSLTVKIDKTNPTAYLSVHAGTLGSGGWYTDDVTVRTSGADDDSDIASCSADQYLTADTSSAGREFNGSCTNNAGLRQNADPLTIKRDASPPTAQLVVTEGTAGSNGWYTSNVKVAVQGADSQSGVTCSAATELTAETTGTQVTGYCTNGAGARTDAAPITIKIDKSGPSAELAATGQRGDNGWFTGNVTVTTSGADSISGGVTCTADQSQTQETAGREFNGSCTNAAGLTSNATAITVKLDKTGPSASAAITNSPAMGTNGWYTSDIEAATTGGDSISAPVTCTKASVSQTAETAGVNLAGVCTNDAGLSTTAAALNVKLDKTAPVTTVTASGTAGNAGWFLSDVTISTSGEDALSGVHSCTADQSQTVDTAGTPFYGSCTNGAGLTNTNERVTVKRDATPPTVTDGGFVSGTAGSNGWYTSEVTNGFSASDPMSGLASTFTTSFTKSSGAAEGAAVRISSGAVSDVAGNTNSGINSAAYKIDRSDPTNIQFVDGPAANSPHTAGSVPVAPTCTADDAVSGLASCVVTGYSNAIGTHTLTATATDNAGRVATATRTYSVVYKWAGFFAPVDNNGVLNKAKAGSAIPVKFSLSGDYGLGVITNIKSVKIACPSSAPVETVEELAGTTSGLKYDSSIDQYNYTWKTASSLAGTCQRLELSLSDGSVARTALFQFTK